MLSELTLKRVRAKSKWSIGLIQYRFHISKEWATAILNELIELRVIEELPNGRGYHKTIGVK